MLRHAMPWRTRRWVFIFANHVNQFRPPFHEFGWKTGITMQWVARHLHSTREDALIDARMEIQCRHCGGLRGRFVKRVES